jgi:CBS domain-containing protein
MSTTLAEVAEKILNARLRAFPVLEDGKLVGIITSSDLIVFVALHEE